MPEHSEPYDRHCAAGVNTTRRSPSVQQLRSEYRRRLKVAQANFEGSAQGIAQAAVEGTLQRYGADIAKLTQAQRLEVVRAITQHATRIINEQRAQLRRMFDQALQ